MSPYDCCVYNKYSLVLHKVESVSASQARVGLHASRRSPGRYELVRPTSRLESGDEIDLCSYDAIDDIDERTCRLR